MTPTRNPDLPELPRVRGRVQRARPAADELLDLLLLDGGHILILALEGVARRDFSDKLKERVIMAGFVFLVAFFGVVIYYDVIKTWFSS